MAPVAGSHSKLGWYGLAKRAPLLRSLEARIKTVAITPHFCANAVWYGKRAGYQGHEGIKPLMSKIVGFTAETTDEIVKTSDAYTVAYRHLYALLPNCRRDCACSFGFLDRPAFRNSPSRRLHAQVTRKQWEKMRTWARPLLLEVYGYGCVACGKPDSPDDPLHIDHVIPVSKGGTNDVLNLQPLCRACNLKKGAKA